MAFPPQMAFPNGLSISQDVCVPLANGSPENAKPVSTF